MANFLTILTYAPAGLGHLRVLNALYLSLPQSMEPLLIGGEDQLIRRFHRLTSTHPLLRFIFEWLQTGPLSFWANNFYRRTLRLSSESRYRQVRDLISKQKSKFKKILIVATHFGLAHELAAIKQKLIEETGLEIFLAVIVTDDTFQHIWYVDGADLLVVPSNYINQKYVQYGQRFSANQPQIVTLPYLLSPNFAIKLSPTEIQDRLTQVDPNQKNKIHVVIPVSGAAVGLGYYVNLIEFLSLASERFFFHIVSKEAPYTKDFLEKMANRKNVDIATSSVDQEVVEAYDSLIDNFVVSLEITKPSEQAFKVLLDSDTKGGVILLLTPPVGKQEVDNLMFLERHFLIPSEEVTQKLWQMPEDASDLLKMACAWRAVSLPPNPDHATKFISWLLKNRFFYQMLTCSPTALPQDPHAQELGDYGVLEFWDLIFKRLDS